MRINSKFVDKYKDFCKSKQFYDKLLYNFFYYMHQEILTSGLYDRCLALNKICVKIEIEEELSTLGFECLSYDIVQHEYVLFYKNKILELPYIRIIEGFRVLLQGKDLRDTEYTEFKYSVLYNDTERLNKLYYESYCLLGEFNLKERLSENTKILTSNYYIVVGGCGFRLKHLEYLYAYKKPMFYILENAKDVLIIHKSFSLNESNLGIICYITKQNEYDNLIELFNTLEEYSTPYGTRGIVDISNWTDSKLRCNVQTKAYYIALHDTKLSFRF